MLNSRAFRIDLDAAVAAISTVVQNSTVTNDLKLVYLMGARHALHHGCVPESCLYALDQLIEYYERNRTLDTDRVRMQLTGSTNDGDTKAGDSGSRCRDRPV